ncbi:MAG: hypothetical protein HKN27_14705 [Silicimonas sp.]|nr:hypothetical protein [Silicimonas sp.]
MPNTKIATCCYCGTRAALTLRGKERHELACSKCGAPLHELKMLRSDTHGERELVRPSPARSYKPSSKKHRGEKPRKRKKQKSLAQRFLEEAWDAAEDVFDIFD